MTTAPARPGEHRSADRRAVAHAAAAAGHRRAWTTQPAPAELPPFPDRLLDGSYEQLSHPADLDAARRLAHLVDVPVDVDAVELLTLPPSSNRPDDGTPVQVVAATAAIIDEEQLPYPIPLWVAAQIPVPDTFVRVEGTLHTSNLCTGEQSVPADHPDGHPAATYLDVVGLSPCGSCIPWAAAVIPNGELDAALAALAHCSSRQNDDPRALLRFTSWLRRNAELADPSLGLTAELYASVLVAVASWHAATRPGSGLTADRHAPWEPTTTVTVHVDWDGQHTQLHHLDTLHQHAHRASLATDRIAVIAHSDTTTVTGDTRAAAAGVGTRAVQLPAPAPATRLRGDELTSWCRLVGRLIAQTGRARHGTVTWDGWRMPHLHPDELEQVVADAVGAATATLASDQSTRRAAARTTRH